MGSRRSPQAGAGFNRAEGAYLHLIGIKTGPVYALRLEDKIVKGQGKQGGNLLARPVVARLGGINGHNKAFGEKRSKGMAAS